MGRLGSSFCCWRSVWPTSYFLQRSWIIPQRVKFSPGLPFGVQKVSNAIVGSQRGWILNLVRKKRCPNEPPPVYRAVYHVPLLSRISRCACIPHLAVIAAFLRDWFSVWNMRTEGCFSGENKQNGTRSLIEKKHNLSALLSKTSHSKNKTKKVLISGKIKF